MSKFIYFPIYARGASIKMLLSHGDVKYEDDQCTFEQFGERKASGEFPNA